MDVGHTWAHVSSYFLSYGVTGSPAVIRLIHAKEEDAWDLFPLQAKDQV